MKKASRVSRLPPLAPPLVSGPAATFPTQIHGDMTDGILPEDWSLFADYYVPLCAKYPTLQRWLGYALDTPVVRYGNPPPNPRWHACMDGSGATSLFMGWHSGVCRG
jgi:hypothetical protein